MQAKRKGVVTARVIGGLGNQLFIYAAARALAVRNGVALELDTISGYTADEYGRTYDLQHFQIKATQASGWHCFADESGERRRYWTRKINGFLPFRCRRYIRQDRPFEHRLVKLRVSGRLYIEGYWQDEKYFKDVASLIRMELQPQASPSADNLVLAQKMASVDSVCLHARRHQYEFKLPPVYYSEAIRRIKTLVPNAHFFCFSDDVGWVRENIVADSPLTIVSEDGKNKNCDDLWLMTQCKHYIIANSTFSWWGAWLNPDPNKIVLAPSRWGYETAIPEAWQSISF